MLIDISCNFTDLQFKDLDKIIQRCKESKTIPILVGLDKATTYKSMEYAEKYNTLFYGGIHPLHSKGAETDFLHNLDSDRMAAIGECGLDYFRLEYSDPETQKRIFKKQLDLQGERYFLHSRDSHRDLLEILSDYKIKGVVHSFTGTIEESRELCKLGYYVGINGCSLKTEEGLEVVRELNLSNILIETDSPYCKIRKSYSGYKYVKSPKKGNNEPSLLNEVVEVIAQVKGIEESELIKAIKINNIDFFGNRLESIIKEWNM